MYVNRTNISYRTRTRYEIANYKILIIVMFFLHSLSQNNVYSGGPGRQNASKAVLIIIRTYEPHLSQQPPKSHQVHLKLGMLIHNNTLVSSNPRKLHSYFSSLQNVLSMFTSFQPLIMGHSVLQICILVIHCILLSTQINLNILAQ